MWETKVLSDEIRELILIEEKIKILTEKSKEMRKELISKIPDEGITIGAANIIRVDKKIFSLKPTVSEAEVMGKFPMAVKSACDMTELRKIPEAHQYLDMTLSSYIKIWTVTAKK